MCQGDNRKQNIVSKVFQKITIQLDCSIVGKNSAHAYIVKKFL